MRFQPSAACKKYADVLQRTGEIRLLYGDLDKKREQLGELYESLTREINDTERCRAEAVETHAHSDPRKKPPRRQPIQYVSLVDIIFLRRM
jgi:hypothetical protein